MKEILIDVGHSNSKVCIVEDGLLVEFWVERKNLGRLVGNIYKGKVANVLPGMQAAFVNIGLEKNAFLYAGDIPEGCEELRGVVSDKLSLREGDQVMVQVVKDMFGTKGARITMNVSLPGRLIVFMPQTDYVGVSRKITDDGERARLSALVAAHKAEGAGYIVRTQAEHCSEEALLEEMRELSEKWAGIRETYLRKKVCSIVYKDEDLAIRAVRDMLRSDVDAVVINNKKLYEEFLSAFPRLVAGNPGLFRYEDANLVARYRLSPQIESLLERRVNLKNGAYLIIDRTEALTVIDVNTGRYVGDSKLEETVFETNRLAAAEIARQLRLRNIGGIVIIDFIDMEEQAHIDATLEMLRAELAKDRVKTSVVGMSSLGLVELTRKKKRSMIGDVMLQPCPYCGGNGYVFSDEHVAARLKEKLDVVFGNPAVRTVAVRTAFSVFNKLFTARLMEKECAEDWRDRRIYVIPDKHMHVQQFEVTPMTGAVLTLPDEARLLY